MRAEAGGEAMDAELAAMLGENGAEVVNAYGPTEVTAVSVQGRATQADIESGGSIPIGEPLAGLRAYVLDARLEPVPQGVAGELVLAGPQLADGYVGRPAQTAEVFIPDPFVAGARAYRTGDLVRWRADGRLEFLGRIDAQVKIRGMRVELSEIETALAALPEVAAAAVAAQKDANGQNRLVAYLTVDIASQQERRSPELLDFAPLEPAEIRRALSSVLPEHMIPQSFARLSHLPLTPSGKVDRKALPTVATELVQAVYAAPEGAMEELIVDQVAKLLAEAAGPETTSPEQIGRNDGFFALGGNSLLAVKLVQRLEAESGLTIPLKVVFEAATIAELAASLDDLQDDTSPGVESEVEDARADIALVQKLPPAPEGQVPSLEKAETILLTGVTGFLGRYLLRDLLTRTEAQIICHVRGEDAASAKKRVLKGLASIPDATPIECADTRVSVALGELSKPDLGLGASDRQRIAQNVDLIVHNGAEVHAMKPYFSLRASNTMSVLDLLRLMSEDRPKGMVLISTLGTLEVELDELKNGFDPDVLTPSDDSGYNLSKWAAERMLITAREKGYQSTILRPGLIIGDSETGYYETSDIGQGYANLFLDTGAVPNAMSSFGLPWINVNRASAMILDMASAEIPHGIGHVFDHGAMPSDVLAKALDVEVLPARAWLARAIEVLEAQPDHPSGWLLSRLRGQFRDLDGIPDEVIPVEEADSMFARYAPPSLPETMAAEARPTPEDGLVPTIRWLANRKKD